MNHSITNKAVIARSIAVFAILLLCITPIISVSFPPLSDLYGHLGRYAVQTRIGQGTPLDAYYAYDWQLIGNLGADLLVEIFQPIFGLERSVWVIVLANQTIAALAILLISYEVHGRITPYAVFALPLIYSYPFTYGFINFTLAMAFAMLAFWGWLRLRNHGKFKLATLLLMFSGVVTWCCHTYGWAFLGLMCGSWSLVSHWNGWRNLLATARAVLQDCFVLFIPIVPMLLWRTNTSGSVTGQWSVEYKVIWVASILRNQCVLVDIVSTFTILAIIYTRVRATEQTYNRGLALAAGLALLVFLLLPARVFGSFMADMRILPYAAILGLLMLSPVTIPKERYFRWMAFALAFLFFRIFVTIIDFQQKEQRIDQVAAALTFVPEGAQVASFDVQKCRGWQPSVLTHVGGLAIARRYAFSNDQWTDPGMNPLSIIYDVPAAYRSDATWIAAVNSCPGQKGPRLRDAITHLPQAVFSHVWIVGELPETAPEIDGYSLIVDDGASMLYQRDAAPPSLPAIDKLHPHADQ